MSLIRVQTALRWQQIGLWSVKVLLALVFIAAGGAKLYGVAAMIQVFDQIGLGQWFRYVTGSIEVLGAVALLIPSAAGFGGTLLAATMVGAALAHLSVVQGSPVPAIVLFALSALVASAHREQTTALVRRLFASRR